LGIVLPLGFQHNGYSHMRNLFQNTKSQGMAIDQNTLHLLNLDNIYYLPFYKRQYGIPEIIFFIKLRPVFMKRNKNNGFKLLRIQFGVC